MSGEDSAAKDLYDRIAEYHNLALRLSGYRRSIASYLRSTDPGIGPESAVLDAGCGTGLVTLGFLDAGYEPRITTGIDLSFRSLEVARREIGCSGLPGAGSASFVQGNVLDLPFPEGSFDLVLSCGVLEYVPLEAGLKEFSRVMRPNARLVFIPVKPSWVGTALEFVYKFKTHPLEEVRRISQRYYRIVEDHEFRITEPIGWSKRLFLLEKV